MNIFIVEDEVVTQMALARMLNSTFPDVKVVGTARTVRESVDFLRSCESGQPDLIFMDVELVSITCLSQSNLRLSVARSKGAGEI